MLRKFFKETLERIKKFFQKTKLRINYLFNLFSFIGYIIIFLLLTLIFVVSVMIILYFALWFMVRKMDELKPFGWEGYIYPFTLLIAAITALFTGYKAFKNISTEREVLLENLLNARSYSSLKNNKECHEKMNNIASKIVRFDDYQESYQKIITGEFTEEDFSSLIKLLERDAKRFGSIKGFVDYVFFDIFKFKIQGQEIFNKLQKSKELLNNYS